MSTASEIIELLGGLTAVAKETGLPLTTVSSWKAANFIPEWRQAALLEVARRNTKPLSTADFPPLEDRIARPKKADGEQAAA